MLLLACTFTLSAQPPAVKEYEVKAAFLFNFTRFAEWPPHSFSSATALKKQVIKLSKQTNVTAFMCINSAGDKPQILCEAIEFAPRNFPLFSFEV